MGGGLMQLVAYGAQDIYLTGNPQITFFKVVYRRHTNFAMEAIEQTFSGVCNFGNKVSCTIARNGDLVHRMYLEIDTSGQPVAGISSVFGDLNRFGHKLIKSIEVDIGGQTIDKHYGEWLEIWSQLTHSFEQLQKLRDMIDGDLTSVSSEKTDKIYIPLQFWFNKNPGLALPLIALQYHEVKLIVEFEKTSNIKFIRNNNDAKPYIASQVKSITDFNANAEAADKFTINTVTLYCDYIFLDTDERRRFAQVSHEYLIEQLQFNESVSATRALTSQAKMNIDLTFNHPCKELVWVCQLASATGTYMYSDGQAYVAPTIALAYVTTKAFATTTTTTDNQNLVLIVDGETKTFTLAIKEYANVAALITELNTLTGFTTSVTATVDGTKLVLTSTGVGGGGGGSSISMSATSGSDLTTMIGNPATDHVVTGEVISGVIGENNNKVELMASGKLQLNGHDRMQTRQGSYYRIVQPYQHHTGGAIHGNELNMNEVSNSNDDLENGYVYCYSFALRPEEHQPSGTCNFSRIDNAVLNMNISSASHNNTSEGAAVAESVNVRVYAVNYNVLRIMSGMGGLAYSN